MFKIGEVSKLTQISIRMLRYYDELGILKPAEIDKYTGHRLYSVEQISILQRIVLLRDSKFSVAEIANIVHNWNDEFVIKELNRKKNEIQKEINQEQQRINKIDKFIEAINCDKDEIHYNVVFKKIPSYKIISLREIIPDYQSEGMAGERASRSNNRQNSGLLTSCILPLPATPPCCCQSQRRRFPRLCTTGLGHTIHKFVNC